MYRARHPGALRRVLGAGLVAALALPLRIHGQSTSASFELPRATVDGGGGSVSSASFSVTATIGQADVGVQMHSASFSLSGGFHRPASEPSVTPQIFADGFESPTLVCAPPAQAVSIGQTAN